MFFFSSIFYLCKARRHLVYFFIIRTHKWVSLWINDYTLVIVAATCSSNIVIAFSQSADKAFFHIKNIKKCKANFDNVKIIYAHIYRQLKGSTCHISTAGNNIRTPKNVPFLFQVARADNLQYGKRTAQL